MDYEKKRKFMIKNLIEKGSSLIRSSHIYVTSHLTNLKSQLIHVLGWILYPEVRKQNSFSTVIKQNSAVMTVFLILSFWSFGFFSIIGSDRFEPQTDDVLIQDTTALIYNDTIMIKEVRKPVRVKKKKKNVNKNLYVEKEVLVRREAMDSLQSDSILIEIRETMGDRKYLETIIQRDCHLRYFHNMQRLPDDIFFTMINEIDKWGIPYTIFFRMVDHESGFRFIPNAGGSGAFGYCQVMPSTFRSISRTLGLSGHTEINNIKAGAYLLKYNYNRHIKRGLSERDAWFQSLVDYSGGNRKLAGQEMQYFSTDSLK